LEFNLIVCCLRYPPFSFHVISDESFTIRPEPSTKGQDDSSSISRWTTVCEIPFSPALTTGAVRRSGIVIITSTPSQRDRSRPHVSIRACFALDYHVDKLRQPFHLPGSPCLVMVHSSVAIILILDPHSHPVSEYLHSGLHDVCTVAWGRPVPPAVRC